MYMRQQCLLRTQPWPGAFSAGPQHSQARLHALWCHALWLVCTRAEPGPAAHTTLPVPPVVLPRQHPELYTSAPAAAAAGSPTPPSPTPAAAPSSDCCCTGSLPCSAAGAAAAAAAPPLLQARRLVGLAGPVTALGLAAGPPPALPAVGSTWSCLGWPPGPPPDLPRGVTGLLQLPLPPLQASGWWQACQVPGMVAGEWWPAGPGTRREAWGAWRGVPQPRAASAVWCCWWRMWCEGLTWPADRSARCISP